MDNAFIVRSGLAAVFVFTTLFGLGTGAAQPPVEGQGAASEWSPDVVAVARLCVSERSFARVRDCPVIAGIVSRLARSAGLPVAEYVARRHWRHTNREHTRRAWIGGLSGNVHKPPAGWPENVVPWQGRGQAMWISTLREARHALENPPARCVGGWPITWGGRVDAGRIARMTSHTGSYVVVDCGHTLNVFLALRGDR